MPACQHRTIGISYARNPNSGGPGACTRRATYVSATGGYYCTQHAKEPATTLRKATGRIQADMRLLTQAEREG